MRRVCSTPQIDETLPSAMLAPRWGQLLVTLIEPGMRVTNRAHPEWGVGQVQSVIGHRMTVNFENIGKVLINAALVDLEILD